MAAAENIVMKWVDGKHREAAEEIVKGVESRDLSVIITTLSIVGGLEQIKLLNSLVGAAYMHSILDKEQSSDNAAKVPERSS